MTCLACGGFGGRPVCGPCLASLRPAPERAVGHGVLVSAVWAHHGAARRMVHRFKYEGVGAIGDFAAGFATAPPGVTGLVPVPRVLTRRLAHGIDPASEFARALAEAWGVDLVPALAVPVWAPRRAGRTRRPGPPPLRARRVVGASSQRREGWVVVDDVVTSGATVAAAAKVLGVRRAVSLTMVGGFVATA